MQERQPLFSVLSIPFSIAAMLASWLSLRLTSVHGILKVSSIIAAGIAVLLALAGLGRATPRYLRVLGLAMAVLACLAAYGLKIWNR
jgi:hypothetical protein